MTPSLYIHRYTLKLLGGPANAHSRRRSVDGFLLRAGDGFGCVHPWPELGDPTMEELLAILRDGRAHRLLARALSCAYADAAARRAGRSLFSGTGTAGIPRSHATVTGEADFAALAAAGFTTVKLKTHDGDRSLPPRVRAASEAGLRVRIDCNGTGITALPELHSLSATIEFIEDPEPYCAARWREIARRLGIPLALDRLERTDCGGYDVRVFKPALDSCQPHPMPAVLTSYMDHPLGQMFAAFTASRYTGEQREAGLLTHHLFEPDAFTGALRCEGPQLFPAPGTGLGFDALLEALPWQRLTPAPGVLLQNPRAPLPHPPRELPEGQLIFPTSGSTGMPSLICLSPAAMMANAAAVNDWLAASPEDVWLRVLPEFHVGGASIRFRADLSGSRVIADEEKWDAGRFVRLISEYGITLTSLVPAQVFDLTAAGLPCPPSLRAVIVGGGRMDSALYDRACALGWPVLPSYGMTEASSQVATALPGSGEVLHLLPCWEARVKDDGLLQLRGAPLLSGRLRCDSASWTPEPVVDAEGWFTTSDRAVLNGCILTPFGRSDRSVKVLGELVDLDAVEAAILRAGLPPERGVIIARPDARAGMRPWLVTDLENTDALLAAVNAVLPPYAAIAGAEFRILPRSPLGKVRRADL